MPEPSILRDREAVRRAVTQGRSIAEALQLLGLRPAGGNYRALHQACREFGLSEPVYVKPPGNAPGRPAARSRPPGSNGSPAVYKTAALPAHELGRHVMVIIAGLAAGCGLALAIRYGSRAVVAEAAVTCLLVLLAAVAAAG